LEGKVVVSINDQKPKTNDQRDCENESRRLASLKADSRTDGTNSDTAANSNCQSENNYELSGEDDFGGVLEELEEIRRAYLSYVKTHEERLELRLKENREHQAVFFERIEKLEKQIQALLKSKTVE
jgi:hypothetical protein